MAKKKKRPVKKTKTSELSRNDKKTLKSLGELADSVVTSTRKRRDLHVDIPSRTLSNVRYSPRKRILEMGTNKNRRQLFNLSQAKAYMQTMLVGSGCKRLIEQQKTTSIRGLYYLLKHTIEGTKEETFADQGECDPIIEDVEVLLDSLREELHLYASNRGTLVGPITLVDSGDTINCDRMGSGGYNIPSIVEPEVMQFVEVRRQVCPACRKRYGLAAIQRRQVLAHTQVPVNARTGAATARRAAAAVPLASRT